MNYRGIIIEESLQDPTILGQVEIIETKVIPAGRELKTPWVSQWTMHTVEFSDDQADRITNEISRSLDAQHPHWYADFKNDTHHYIVYLMKVFKIALSDMSGYEQAKAYGRSLGIPPEQLDFV